MAKCYRLYLTVLVALLFVGSALTRPAHAQDIGNCAQTRTYAYLDVNNVRARIFSHGGLFWHGDPHVYEVPRFGDVNAIFAAGLWVGGKIGGEVHLAGSTYSPYEFWPGPIPADGTPPDSTHCAAHDGIYHLYADDIRRYETTGEASPELRNWPWHLGAPVRDGDGIPNNYDLEAGDRPDVPGHQNLWWVMNDLGNEHARTGGRPIGLEVQGTAFAFASEDEALNHTTFYRYRLRYRGTQPLDSTYVAFWVDPDLGNFDDDFVGSDITRDMGFVYNADNFDEGHYGEAPPALGVRLLRGPRDEGDGRDNDGDRRVDERGERLGMTVMMYHNGGSCIFCDPQSAQDYYYYMQARWRDGKPLTVGGNGRDFSDTPTTYAYPGDPTTGAFWSEVNVDGKGNPSIPADRRFLVATGPFTLEPGEEEEIVFALVWARGTDHLASVRVMKQASDVVRDVFDAGLEVPLPPLLEEPARPLAPADGASSQPTNLTLRWEPVSGDADYEFTLARDSSLTGEVLRTVLPPGTTSLTIDTLSSETTYYWQVRPRRAGALGPLPPVWRFSTGGATLRVPGPLLLNPTNPNSYAWVEIVGPGGSDPCPPGEWRLGCEEVGGDRVWFSLNSTDAYSLRPAGETDPAQYIGRYAPHDFEMRFTEKGSYALHAFTSGRIVHVPFELWDIGPVGPFHENDPADDVQLVPVLYADGGGECSFGYGETTVGFYDGDVSATDRFYAFYPVTDYAAWEAAAAPLVEAHAEGCPVLPENVPAPVDITSRPPLQSLVLADFGESGELPGTGTVIRFYTTDFGGMPAPIPAAPADGAGTPPGTVTLWWNSVPEAERHHVQVATAPDFAQLVVEDDHVPEASFVVDSLTAGTTYYWRVRVAGEWPSPWSQTWRFQAVEEKLVEPPAFRLAPNFPNPFREGTTIGFELPEPKIVRLEVYDVLGRRVARLVDAALPAGPHAVRWTAEGLASGVYFCRIRAGEFEATQTMLLVR